MKKIFAELFEQFVKSNKREPKGMELIQLKFKANKLQREADKIIEFPRDKIQPLDPDDALPNYKETPGEYSRRNTPGSIENLREEMKIAYRNEFDRLTGNETAEELTDMLKNLDTDGVPFAEGGSTSTGLNYLVGEDDTNSRVPYAAGGRRGFLKLLAGLGAAGVAFKTGLMSLTKGGVKPIVKELTSVPIGNPQGMPVWFKPLVNKIIKEGDDVTKKFGTVDRELVHTKRLDEFEEATVYQDLSTGNVRLEYGPHLTDDTGKVIRASNEPTVIQLEYRAPEVIEPNLTTGKGGGKTKEEFSAIEAEPEIVNWDGDIEMSGENLVNTVDDLITDTSKLQKYATDNKLTIKELSDSMKKQKYKNKLESDPMEQVNYIENKSGMDAMDYIDEGTRVGDFDPKGYRNYDTKGMNLYDGIKKIKKADGGRMGYAGGKKVVEGLASLIKKKFGDNAITTADKLKTPQKTLDREMFKKFDDRNPDQNRLLTDAEIEDYEMELGDTETWMMDGTLREAEKAVVDQKEYMADIMKMKERGDFGDFSPSKLDDVNDNQIEEAVQNIFPTGDTKLDAEMAAESLVELNPQIFGDVLLDDLDDITRSKIYGAVYDRLSNNMAKMIKEKRNLSSPTKTLEGIKKTGTIDISDPDIADEFARFMKEKNPKGYKDMEQKIQLESFDPKKTKGNAEGGRIGLLAGGGVLKKLIMNLAKEKGMSGSEVLKVMNYKSLPSKIKNLMKKEEFDAMKANRLEGVEIWRDLMSSQQEMTRNIDAGKNTPAAELFEMLEKTSPGYGTVPRNISDADMLQMEQMIKNMKTKNNRQLNAKGGLANLLGE